MKYKNLVSGIILVLLSSTLYATPILYFDFDGDGLQDTTTSVALGGSVTAGLYISNVDNVNGGLISWGTEIGFTNTLLSANTYSIGSSWPVLGASNNIDNSSGTIELFAASFSAQTGTIKLADIVFDTLTTGLASLTLGELFPSTPLFDAFVAASGYVYDADIDYSLAAATINITAVPEPPILALLSLGFVGIGFSSRKRK